MRKLITAAILTLVVSGCATSPEQTLKKGYDIITASATTATVLLDRDAISSDEGKRIFQTSTIGKASLDAGKDALIACRAADPKAKCTGAVANINLGSGVLLELEKYLEAHQ